MNIAHDSANGETRRLDSKFAQRIGDADRQRIWESASTILDAHELGQHTVLALGYVQSGKTTSMAALCASAADRNYSIVVALLGTTHLLANQNRDRLADALGLEDRNYRWYMQTSIAGRGASVDLANWLRMGRIVLVPVLKNAAQIRKVSTLLADNNLLGESKVLIIDDEADQASLNTQVSSGLRSSTHASIVKLLQAVPNALYVQYTATPYAPLLIRRDDPLAPQTVVVLEPGHGYTGGREFLLKNRESVVRELPFSDENIPADVSFLPESLLDAVAAFVAGSALLVASEPASTPISMLIHATQRNDIQGRIKFLLDRYLRNVRDEGSIVHDSFRKRIESERARLIAHGVGDVDDVLFLNHVESVINNAVVWLINSKTDSDKVQWNSAPFHILVGGNKLDRGFTVEGLTVSYLSRKASDQIDTLEQRARAFGYRSDLIPYCQIFASQRTLTVLTSIVHTEEEMRASLVDWIDAGRDVSLWGESVGFVLPTGTRPSRKSVLSPLHEFNAEGDWMVLRRPLLHEAAIRRNAELVSEMRRASLRAFQYGRLAHEGRVVSIDELRLMLQRWEFDPVSPSWRHEYVVELLERLRKDARALVLFLGYPGSDFSTPRQRLWRGDVGFVNLFQGRDLDSVTENRYEGDREAGLDVVGRDEVVLQIHHVSHPDSDQLSLHTLAIHLGASKVVRRMSHGGVG
jgi:hypothetical protein